MGVGRATNSLGHGMFPPVGRPRGWKNRFMMVIYKESKITPTFLCVTMQRGRVHGRPPHQWFAALWASIFRVPQSQFRRRLTTAESLQHAALGMTETLASWLRDGHQPEKPGPLLKAFNMAKGRVSQGRSLCCLWCVVMLRGKAQLGEPQRAGQSRRQGAAVSHRLFGFILGPLQLEDA